MQHRTSCRRGYGARLFNGKNDDEDGKTNETAHQADTNKQEGEQQRKTSTIRSDWE